MQFCVHKIKWKNPPLYHWVHTYFTRFTFHMPASQDLVCNCLNSFLYEYVNFTKYLINTILYNRTNGSLFLLSQNYSMVFHFDTLYNLCPYWKRKQKGIQKQTWFVWRNLLYIFWKSCTVNSFSFHLIEHKITTYW